MAAFLEGWRRRDDPAANDEAITNLQYPCSRPALAEYASSAMDHSISLPPPYRPVAADPADDPLSVAATAAADGAAPGVFVWSPRYDRADCAVVLAPETPLSESLLVSYVAMTAAGDALGALIPPAIPVAFGWPDRIVVGGATAGGIRLAAPDPSATDRVPDWMAAGVTFALRRDLASETVNRAPNGTTLEEEGCGDLETVGLLESFSRHLLYWMDRWQDEGFGPVKAAWLARAVGYGPNAGMEREGGWARRKLLQLNADGGVRYSENDNEVAAPLTRILERPSWVI